MAGASSEQMWDLQRCVADLAAERLVRARTKAEVAVALDTVIAALGRPGYVGEVERMRLAGMLVALVRDPVERDL